MNNNPNPRDDGWSFPNGVDLRFCQRCGGVVYAHIRQCGECPSFDLSEEIHFTRATPPTPDSTTPELECDDCHHKGPRDEDGRCLVYIGHLVDPEGPNHWQTTCFCKCTFAAPASPLTVPACVKCGHERSYVYADKDFCAVDVTGGIRGGVCGCKCDFPTAQGDTVPAEEK